MAKFVWQPPGQEPLAFAIRQERVAVGRDAVNDIRLPEPAISSRHAVVITRMGVSTVHDLNSSNGTWINGKKIESQQLKHGDIVQFGRMSMTFVDESGAASAAGSRLGTTQRDATVTLGVEAAAPVLARHASTGNFQISPPPQVQPEAPDIADLDRLMGAIREFRSSENQSNAQKRDEMFLEWKKAVSYCTALKSRLNSEPRVRYFEISERRNEIVVRVESARDQTMKLIMLSWGHMDQREKPADGIWFRQPLQVDKRYEKCADVMRDLVTTIAHMLV